MIKSDKFRELSGYNEKLTVAEDNEFFKRLSKKGKIRMNNKLFVYHTARRAHNIGWSKLLFFWWINLFMVSFLGRSYNKEWKVIR